MRTGGDNSLGEPQDNEVPNNPVVYFDSRIRKDVTNVFFEEEKYLHFATLCQNLRFNIVPQYLKSLFEEDTKCCFELGCNNKKNLNFFKNLI